MTNKNDKEVFPVLTGQCILDDSSIQKLENKFREKVTKEIIECKEMSGDDCVEIMKKFGAQTYIYVIRDSIDAVIKKYEDENLILSNSTKKYVAQLKTIRSVLSI